MTTSTTHNTNPRMRSRFAMVVGVAAIGIVTFAGPVSAQQNVEPTEDQIVRIELACNRIPNLTTRTENLLDRINGDAQTPGSLLWLDARIVETSDRGREDLAVVLENRRAVRESVIPVLNSRLDRLDELDTRCSEAGFDQ